MVSPWFYCSYNPGILICTWGPAWLPFLVVALVVILLAVLYVC